ncbi:hypothetical protein C8J57DRAFT_1063354 [Mycena rebaudengoi]|nr:hypothetical protein C8J57DRAFT_1063354 [Mycena rebaudengoi]
MSLQAGHGFRFVELPPELIIHIFHYLDLPALISCLATNRQIKSTIEGSTSLQYLLLTQEACVEDNPRDTGHYVSQRLAILCERQAAFNEFDMDPASAHTLSMHDFPVRQSYALSGGFFFMVELDRRVVKYISLAAAHQPNPPWKRLQLAEHILEMAGAVPEDDLLIVVTFTAVLQSGLSGLPSDALIELQLFEVSTASYHPQAKEPRIDIGIPSSELRFAEFELDIAGDKLVLFITHSATYVDPTLDRVLVYDWKRGVLQMTLQSPFETYLAAVFVSSDVLLLAGIQTGVLELWKIPDTPENVASAPLVSLGLPRLLVGGEYLINKIEYTPKGTAMSSMRPFSSTAADSIIMLHIVVINEWADAEHDLHFVVPRKGLLAQIPVTPSTGLVRLWTEWGPPISRWMKVPDTKWPTIISGQRMMFVEHVANERRRIILVDFNPYAYRRALLQLQEGIDPPTRRVVSDAIDQFPGTYFSEPVDSHLGYLQYTSQGDYTHNGVLMDEEWIVGIRVGFAYIASSLKFWLMARTGL